MKKLIILIGASLLWMQVSAQLQPTKLSVFSTGTFFEQQEGKLSFTNNVAYVNLPGTILQGTFWLAGNTDVKIRQIDVAIDTVKKAKEAQYIDDFVKASVGKNVSLRFKQNIAGLSGGMRILSGTLLSFNTLNGLIKLKTTDAKIVLINIATLNDLELDASASYIFEADTLIRRATIILDKPVAQAPFNQVSMQTGLQWQPSYFIKLENDKDARMVMKATVENATGIGYTNVDLELVVGTPQMYFGQTIDPISNFYIPTEDVFTWDYGDNGTYRQSAFRNAYDTIRLIEVGNKNVPKMNVRGKLFETIFGSGGAPASYGDLTGGVIDISNGYQVALDITADKDYTATGAKAADLYYYKAGKVSLPKDAKTLLPISQSTISYKHVYEATVGDVTNYAYNKTIISTEQKTVDVFHSLKFFNKTGAPFTEAPVFVVNENEDPIAQDKLNYTPINEEATIKLAKAIDVVVKGKEEEIGKDEKARKFNKKTYDKVILKGTLDLANFLDKPITLTLKKALRGEVIKNDGGTVSKPARFNEINPISLIKWEVDLKPGEKKTISYEYEVYIMP